MRATKTESVAATDVAIVPHPYLVVAVDRDYYGSDEDPTGCYQLVYATAEDESVARWLARSALPWGAVPLVAYSQADIQRIMVGMDANESKKPAKTVKKPYLVVYVDKGKKLVGGNAAKYVCPVYMMAEDVDSAYGNAQRAGSEIRVPLVVFDRARLQRIVTALDRYKMKPEEV